MLELIYIQHNAQLFGVCDICVSSPRLWVSYGCHNIVKLTVDSSDGCGAYVFGCMHNVSARIRLD
jgi:hypothetical protein